MLPIIKLKLKFYNIIFIKCHKYEIKASNDNCFVNSTTWKYYAVQLFNFILLEVYNLEDFVFLKQNKLCTTSLSSICVDNIEIIFNPSNEPSVRKAHKLEYYPLTLKVSWRCLYETSQVCVWLNFREGTVLKLGQSIAPSYVPIRPSCPAICFIPEHVWDHVLFLQRSELQPSFPINLIT